MQSFHISISFTVFVNLWIQKIYGNIVDEEEGIKRKNCSSIYRIYSIALK